MNEDIDHLVIDTNTGKFKCEICGEEDSPPVMPVPIDTLIEAMDHFTSQHRACKPPAEAVMSEYIRGFNSGFEFVLHEVENYITKANSHDAMVLVQLLSHLKMEDKPNE
jgi:hypothetical protein